MIQVIAFTQFIFFTLGLMGLTIIVKAHGGSKEISPFSHLLVSYGLWLIMVPILWTVFSRACLVMNKGIFTPQVAKVSGVILTIALILVYGVAIAAPYAN